MGERECCFHVRGIPSGVGPRDYLDATGAAVPWHRPGSRFGVVREDDLEVVSEDDDVLSAVGYRPNVRQLLHSAHGYVFDAAVVVAIVLTQAQVWTHEDHPHGRLAVMAFLSAGALLFRRVAPFLAPVVCAAARSRFAARSGRRLRHDYDVLRPPAGVLGVRLAPEPAPGRSGIRLGAARGWMVILRAPGSRSEALWLSFPLAGVFVLSVAAAPAGRAGAAR